MSARLVAELWCDRCWRPVDVPVDSPVLVDAVARLRRRSAKDGWSRPFLDGDLTDLCPACTADRVGYQLLSDLADITEAAR